MKVRLLAIVLPALVAFGGIGTPANADVITFTNADLSRSTTEGFLEITAPGIAPSFIPADSTFTLPFDGILPAEFSGVWYRLNFVLPAGVTNPSMNIELLVDNEVQLFLNDQIAAVEDDTDADNFIAPFPEFTLNSDGTVTDNFLTWDALPISQGMFQSGVNELTFFATNNGGPGAFSLISGGSIEFNVTPPTGVPEPGSAVLLGLGLLGAAVYRRRRRATRTAGC